MISCIEMFDIIHKAMGRQTMESYLF